MNNGGRKPTALISGRILGTVMSFDLHRLPPPNFKERNARTLEIELQFGIKSMRLFQTAQVTSAGRMETPTRGRGLVVGVGLIDALPELPELPEWIAAEEDCDIELSNGETERFEESTVGRNDNARRELGNADHQN